MAGEYVWTIVISVETYRKSGRTLSTFDFTGKVQFCPEKKNLCIVFSSVQKSKNFAIVITMGSNPGFFLISWIAYATLYCPTLYFPYLWKCGNITTSWMKHCGLKKCNAFWANCLTNVQWKVMTLIIMMLFCSPKNIHMMGSIFQNWVHWALIIDTLRLPYSVNHR